MGMYPWNPTCKELVLNLVEIFIPVVTMTLGEKKKRNGKNLYLLCLSLFRACWYFIYSNMLLNLCFIRQSGPLWCHFGERLEGGDVDRVKGPFSSVTRSSDMHCGDCYHALCLEWSTVCCSCGLGTCAGHLLFCFRQVKSAVGIWLKEVTLLVLENPSYFIKKNLVITKISRPVYTPVISNRGKGYTAYF